MVKRIAVLTRDCAGINAAIRAVVRSADRRGIEVLGILRGFDGLMDGEFVVLNRRSVSGIVNLGGSILKTARAKRFFDRSGRQKAIRFIRSRRIDGLVVIGGNGSMAGGHVLAAEQGIPVVGIPATIDNDINGIDMAVGADTAVNVAVDALDKIRDTALSLERIFVVEVMGRECGYIALQVALAGGCEEVLLPERKFDLDKVVAEIEAARERGKVSWIIIVAEGRAHASDVADAITRITGYETRIAVLGHIQRGGRPTAQDRILASRLGYAAVELIHGGAGDRCVVMKGNRTGSIALSTAVRPKKIDIEAEYRLIKILT